MGRPKTFSREEVLAKAVPVFWEHGFADTSVQELERATGVNKSGLYTEFAGKEDLFLASLQYYVDTGPRRKMLAVAPLGWENIERFLKMPPRSMDGQKGCFCVSSMRELPILPPQAATIMGENRGKLKQLIATNIEAARPQPQMSAEILAEMVMTFFTGISTEQYLDPPRAALLRRIDNFMTILRSL